MKKILFVALVFALLLAAAPAANASFLDDFLGFLQGILGSGAIGSSSCIHANPGVYVGPSSVTATAPHTEYFYMRITNRDSAGCTARAFSIKIQSCPTGWSCTNPSNKTISPGKFVEAWARVYAPAGTAYASRSLTWKVQNTTETQYYTTKSATFRIVRCTSGLCCDRTYSRYTFRPSSYKCAEDINAMYSCNVGTACGDDVYAQHQDKYCSGTSASCSGAVQWDGNWAVADDCNSSEKCTGGVATCSTNLDCAATCIDSDGGKNIYVKGTTTGKLSVGGGCFIPYYPDDNMTLCGGDTFNLSDKCNYRNSNHVDEFYCVENSLIYAMDITCPSGYSCSDGACVQNTT